MSKVVKPRENLSSKIQLKIMVNVILSILITSFFVSSFLIINFLNNLKNDKSKFIKTEVESKVKIIDNEILKKIELSKQIASRTMIKRELIKYNENKISKSELINYTEDKLYDAIKEIDSLVSLTRYSANNEKILTLREDIDIKDYTMSLDNFKEFIITLLLIRDELHLVIENSIIDDNKQYIGKDLIIFDISNLIDIINSEKQSVILNQHSNNKNIVFKNSTANKIDTKCDINNKHALMFTKKIDFIDINYNYIICKKDFYKNIKSEILAVLLITITLTLIAIGITFLILYPLTGKIIIREEHLLKEIEDKTKEIEKEIEIKNNFYQILAHDLKNPISANISFLDLMIDEIENNRYNKDEILEKLKIIFSNNINILEMFEKILTWSQSQKKNLKVKKIRFKVIDVVNESVSILSQNISKKNLNLKITGDNNLFIIADKNMIETVVRNILSNSIKFTENNKKIKIDLSHKRKKTIIKIQDEGVGIEESKLKTIFEYKNFQSTKSTDGTKGMGLGLIFCKEFIEKNNGKLKIESKINIGTTVIIEI